MPNPDGVNQFGGFGVEPPYGDVSRQKSLLREAPISGAPISGHALGTPDRIRQRRGNKPSSSRSPGTPAALPQLPIPYEQQIALVWQQIAAHPGASDLVRQVAQEASGG